MSPPSFFEVITSNFLEKKFYDKKKNEKKTFFLFIVVKTFDYVNLKVYNLHRVVGYLSS